MPARLRRTDADQTYSLEDFNLIGRSQDATICLTDAGVSRQHATIRRDGRLFWLMDLGSANGSYVNDVAVNAARVLRHGDRVQFGTSTFVFDHDESEGAGEGSGASTTQVLRTISMPVKTIRATLLVGDLRDFTRISSQLTPEEVAKLLREWYADCEKILKGRGAIIDKFIGDGVFAYWPGTDEDTRLKACEAARLLSSIDSSASPTRRWLRENMGIAVQCHVGLHVGDVAMGAMGRGVNTAVGETVNVTFRIESLTRKLNQPVLVSSNFVEGLQDAAGLFEPMGVHAVKGQPEPVEVYSLRVLPGAAPAA